MGRSEARSSGDTNYRRDLLQSNPVLSCLMPVLESFRWKIGICFGLSIALID